MKKYLMTGVAALAMTAAMTSCSSHDGDLYNPEQIAQNTVEARLAAYDKGFNEAFPGLSTTHTWGFGTTSRTRANLNMNGNMWSTCPELKTNEEADVTAYVNMTRAQMKVAEHKYTEVFPENLVNYFVTQVHCGTDEYTDMDKHSGILGSSKMNHLQIAETATATITNGALSEGWFHVNNFNRGDDTDWKGNTLVGEAGTFDFAYLGSEDSKYHNKWIAVDGADISSEYAGYYYICFDFEQYGDPSVYTNFQAPGIGLVAVPGAWESTEEAVAAGAVGKVWVSYDSETGTNTYRDEPVASNWTWGNVVGGNQWVKANDVYTDWIIRLVKATPKDEEVKGVRVICEDMAGSSNDDFDFNDAVFDLDLNEDGYVTKITLLHTGAEYGISIDGKEIHEALGIDKNPNRPEYYLMGSGNYSFTPSSNSLRPADVEVVAHQVVETKDENGEIVYKRYDVTLAAPTGHSTGKIVVKRTFQWCGERECISKKYPKFLDYVKDESVVWY